MVFIPSELGGTNLPLWGTSLNNGREQGGALQINVCKDVCLCNCILYVNNYCVHEYSENYRNNQNSLKLKCKTEKNMVKRENLTRRIGLYD